jgi:hypothetical protein
MSKIENYEVVLVPAEDDGQSGEPARNASGSASASPDALALMEHDVIITFDQNDWPANIPAGLIAPQPVLDVNLTTTEDGRKALTLNCPIRGGIEEVVFVDVPDEVADLLRQAGRATFAGLNEQGVVWEQTLDIYID